MKIVTVIGARPQFIKAAVVSRTIEKYNESAGNEEIEEVIVHTGQHYDANMSEVFFKEMSIPQPKYNLHLGGGTHGAMTGRMLEKLEEVMLSEKPDVVLVYGDTDSTLVGSVAASKLHIPVAHVTSNCKYRGFTSMIKKCPHPCPYKKNVELDICKAINKLMISSHLLSMQRKMSQLMG